MHLAALLVQQKEEEWDDLWNTGDEAVNVGSGRMNRARISPSFNFGFIAAQ